MIFPPGFTIKEVILKHILHPVVRLLDSTHYTFSNGALTLVIFDKWFNNENLLHQDGTIVDWTVGGRPLQLSQVHVKDSECVGSLSLPPVSKIAASSDDIPNQVLEELRTVFTLELHHTVYISFLKQSGLNLLDLALKNHVFITNLCREYEQETKLTYPNILPSFQLSDYNNKENRT